MPCNDVTEIIRVVLDDQDRLSDYAFTKRTCGQGVGVVSLLLEHFKGRHLDELLALDAASFGAAHPVEEELEEFLMLKHFFAVQGALEVLTGREAGGPQAVCAAAEVIYDEGACTIEAEIKVDMVTEKIKACGGCAGCGVTKEAPPRPATVG